MALSPSRPFSRMKWLMIAWSAIVSHSLCSQSNPPVTELYQMLTEYLADYGSLKRYYHIPDSPERRERLRDFFETYKRRLDHTTFNNLSTGGQVDFILFRRELEQQLHTISLEASEYELIKSYTAVANPLYDLERQRRRGGVPDGPRIASTLHDVLQKLKTKSAETQTSPKIAPALTQRAAGVVSGQREALRSVFHFYNEYDPAFSWWVKKPFADLDTALADYIRLLHTRVDSSSLPKDDGSGIIGQPIGRQELIRQLKMEMIPYTPEELLQIAQREFAWCDAEMLKASREMGFGDNWQKAMEKVKQSFVPPGEQPAAMLELYKQSIDFLRQHDLLTIPPLAEETWRMGMIPPERQRISPFFLGGEVLQISYPTDDMTHTEKMMSMRGNNPHFSRATVHHELIAGHHLQQFMNQRHHAYRFFDTPFWTEGWALYWEMLLWDMDFPRSPDDRVGMLFWRMHRCARIIFSIKYHQGEWTPQQCIDFLVDRVGHERANAEGEIRRSFTGGYGPLYQIAYMIGGQQFYALKKELVDSGKMTYKEFHDAVLKENILPVEMVRAVITRQPLRPDFTTSWRFYPL